MLAAHLPISPFGLNQAEKWRQLLPELMAMTEHHRRNCAPYARLLHVMYPRASTARRLSELPFVPVSLFKSHRLCSVPTTDVVRELHSSSTTGQTPSRIFLDGPTARLQTLALAQIMGHVLGPKRLPMLVCDHRGVLKKGTMSARGAGVLGMMTFGQQPVFALDDHLRLDVAAVRAFAKKVGTAPCLMFGFTYIIWRHLLQALDGIQVRLPGAICVHSGGWKKMQAEAVDNAQFKATLASKLGVKRCINFYGMVEQVGAVFIEGDDGLLYPPAFAEVLIRRPNSLAVADPGEPGVIQVLSCLPRSYPGHSLLTEDWGVIAADSNDSLGQRGFRVLGRVPRAEPRGCGDLRA